MAGDPITRWSIGSPDGRYRWLLGRRWCAERPWMLVVGLNPSTADGDRDDPTSRRCIGFARDWGFGGLLLANLYALRSTDPRGLAVAADPVGRHNQDWLRRARAAATLHLAAWGVHGLGPAADALLADGTWWCLGRTRAGAPRHPLYVARSAEPVRLTDPITFESAR